MSNPSLRGAIIAALAAGCLIAGAASAVGRVGGSASPAASQLDIVAPDAADTPGVYVEFHGTPATIAYAEVIEASGGPSPASISSATRAARQSIEQARRIQDEFVSALRASGVEHEVWYRLTRVANGIVMKVPGDQLAAVASLPGVRRIAPVYPEYPTNATSVPFIGAPQVWDNVLATLPRGSTGEGISIAIIDTGIDYQHAHFGGTGLLADYQANDRTSITDAIQFPTAKVVGGFDFAGDAYTGGSGAAPDPDPMDCNGHGTHVAGTAAGYGVTVDGATYAGPWDSAQDYSGFRIGPGVAPGAQLYALRVFGCSGSTSLTAQAIEWAVDPNDDGDFSDRVDVVNMSLGSNFGDRFNLSSYASDNIARLGVIVVASAGNAGDTFFISGSPGAGSRVMAVANTVDSGIAASSTRVNAPAPIAGLYAAGAASFGILPGVGGLTGDLVYVDDGVVGTGTVNDGCETPFTNAAALAGKIALVDRGVCAFELKALNAQLNGAIGVVVANNAAGVPPGMADDAAIVGVTIPVISVTQADGNLFKANIAAPVNLSIYSGADTVNSSSSRGPRRASPLISLKPDIAAPGTNIVSAQTGITSGGFQAGNAPLALSGTSMAAPHMAGVMALLRDLHPQYSVEELKALAMGRASNALTTLPDGDGFRYPGSRVGSGRVDTLASAEGGVVVYNADDVGVVSLTFDSPVAGAVTRTKTLRLVNHTATPQTYDVTLDVVADAPGVEFSLPVNSVTVPANGSTTFDVQMDADASGMDHVREPTLAATQLPVAPIAASPAFNVAAPRHYLAEESANVIFSQAGVERIRVPAYMAHYPVSNMSAADEIVTAGSPTGSTTIALSGQDVCTGTRGPGPACTVSGDDQVSLVSPFELHGQSGRNAQIDPAYDLQYAGVAYTSSSDQLHFGVSTWGPWSSPTDVSFHVDIDCGVYAVGASFGADTCSGAPDGIFDVRVVAANRGSLNALFVSGGSNTGIDVYQVAVFGLVPPRDNSALLPTNAWVNGLPANVINTRLLHNQVQFISVDRTLLKVSGQFRYRVGTCAGLSPRCTSEIDSLNGPFTWNHTAQGLDFNGALLADDLDGGSIPVSWNTANIATNGSLGALLLHHHNAEGNRAEIVTLDVAAQANASATMSIDDPAPAVGDEVEITFEVTNEDATDAIAPLVATLDLPDGVTYVSHSGGGTFVVGTSTWTVANLAAGASEALVLTLRVDESSPRQVVGRITSTTPLDPDPSDNEASVWINAPLSADLEVEVASAGTGGLAFEISVTNNGPDQAFNVSVSEEMLAGAAEPVQPTGVVASQGSYDPVSGVWSIPSLGVGTGPATIELTFAVPLSEGASFTLGAEVTSDTADPDSSNNESEFELVIPVAVFADGFE